MVSLFTAIPLYLIYLTVKRFQNGEGLRWITYLSTIIAGAAFVRIVFSGVGLKGSPEFWVYLAIIGCILVPAICWTIYLGRR